MDPFTTDITIFVLAVFVGYYVVWSVTPALHTPLMSVTNAISGIIIVGALIAVGSETISAAGSTKSSAISFSHLLGFFAVMLASINIFGGFFVTHRMLRMFKKKK
ncbi:MAG: NAD(P) transhydrogenase subunit alpha [Alphaproteobacteria bacterium MarineAlpha9_Bin7]|nr:MAG: NAD(P) transhydrogenase subunit alpha [Alphaproteobacteria bacterium MarineAlpha9_Bin7]